MKRRRGEPSVLFRKRKKSRKEISYVYDSNAQQEPIDLKHHQRRIKRRRGKNSGRFSTRYQKEEGEGGVLREQRKPRTTYLCPRKKR